MAGEEDLYGEWRAHLTPELRKAFERKGQEIVTQEIRAYAKLEKRLAAQVWLAEQRDKDRKRDSRRFWAIFAVATATLFAAILVPILVAP